MAGLSAGRRLVRMLNKSLAPNTEWTESEQATLGLIEDSADRVEALKGGHVHTSTGRLVAESS
jgi:hypothetical protein